VAPGGQVVVPLYLALDQEQVYSIDTQITWDANVASVVRVERGAKASAWSLSTNTTTPGELRAALAGAVPIAATGEVLRITFAALGGAGTRSDLVITRAVLDEGRISATRQNGALAVAWPERTIALVRGWNLISLPVMPTVATLPDALASLGGAYDLVYAYEAANTTNPWRRFVPTAPPVTNDLTALDRSMGLWLHATAAVTLTLPGAAPAGMSIPLKAGWNLVGYPCQTTQSVGTALASLGAQCDMAYTYDARNPTNPWKTYNASAPSALNTLTAFEPGRGYWLHVLRDCTWTVPQG
jgi:hypothetical protein